MQGSHPPFPDSNSSTTNSPTIISHQQPCHPGMIIVPVEEQQEVGRIRGGCWVCPGGQIWVCSTGEREDKEAEWAQEEQQRRESRAARSRPPQEPLPAFRKLPSRPSQEPVHREDRAQRRRQERPLQIHLDQTTWLERSWLRFWLATHPSQREKASRPQPQPPAAISSPQSPTARRSQPSRQSQPHEPPKRHTRKISNSLPGGAQRPELPQSPPPRQNRRRAATALPPQEHRPDPSRDRRRGAPTPTRATSTRPSNPR